MDKKEIIDKLQTIVRNAGKSSITDVQNIKNLIWEIENERFDKGD